MGIGGIIGGLIGDEVGNVGGGFVFDKVTQLNPQQREQAKQKVRNLRRDSDYKMISEDEEKPGGL